MVSGKVNKVGYNVGSKDQYYHQYEYDGDNRITKVFTSKDNIWWDNDAKYSYYNHGPLARTVIGDLEVQGMDYAYTLHGWLKGVNSNTMQADRDMGKDGAPGSTRQYVARDAMGYTLGYYAGDYSGIKAIPFLQQFEATNTGSDLMAARQDLFNGNISHMETAMPNVSSYNATRTITPSVRGGAYKYDQLNRLMEARSFFNVNLATNAWQSGGGSPIDYLENFTYDAMGNIKHVNRWGNGGLQMDNMDYKYNTSTAIATMGNLLSNRLYHVNDGANATNYTDDIDDQGVSFNNVPIDPLVTSNVNTVNNYGYDELGNLKRDNAEQIANIEWTVYGKIKKVTRTGVSTKPDLEFVYDAGGNRICKIVMPKPLSVATYKYSYYLRDAQGNEMANYELNMLNTTTVKDLTVTARPIYGSSRLGVDNRKTILWLNGSNVSIDTPSVIKYRTLSLKSYELSNHLGNVLVTVSDKRIAKTYGVNTVDYFEPEITTISDYYAFGSPMPTRTWSDPNAKYKYGFNGQEKDNEIASEGNYYTAVFWEYDSRLGRRWNIDPIVTHYNSTYVTFSNNPIIFIDPNGDADLYWKGKWIGNDGIDDNLIVIVKSKEIKKEIKKHTSAGNYYTEHCFQHGQTSKLFDVIHKSVLEASLRVLENAIKTEDNFALEHLETLNKNPDGTYSTIFTSSGGKIVGTRVVAGDYVPGDVNIHSHGTGTMSPTPTTTRSSNADLPSPCKEDGQGGYTGDMCSNGKSGMNIIVGKSGYTNDGGGGDTRLYVINFFDTNHKPLFSIFKNLADKIVSKKNENRKAKFINKVKTKTSI